MAYSDNLFKVSIETTQGTIECVGGSFNSVPFFVEESNTNGGRNVVTTALPFTDQHINEDVGKQIREFSIRFYLVGENCESQRESLEEAFNAEGAFELIHPHYGRMMARCKSYGMAFTKSEQQYISGDVTFIPEADPKKAGFSVVDLRGQTEEKLNGSASKAMAFFNESFKIAGAANTIVTAAVDAADVILDKIEAGRTLMRKVSAFVQNLSQIRDNLAAILNTPADFAARIENLITMTQETFGDDDLTDYVNESLVVLDSIEVNDGIMASDEAQNKIQTMALMFAAKMVAKTVLNARFNNADEVHQIQVRIADCFERAMEKVSNVDDYANLADLEATLSKYLHEVVSKLAVIVEMPLKNTRDILTVTFDCYGSLDKMEEIIERNEISDPSVIIRKSLKVLSK